MKNEYLLLTPGPLSTSESVREAMLNDWCTWDEDYNKGVVEVIRSKLVKLATKREGYTCTLMQGSGTASVEAVIGSSIDKNSKLLIIDNGAYGARIAQIAQYMNTPNTLIAVGEMAQPTTEQVDLALSEDPRITHVAMVHCETTTGILNPAKEIGEIVKKHDKIFILDAMSSFGGIPMDIGEIGVDFMISSANKCIQGVPGFGFVISKQTELEKCKGIARSLTLDLYDQWLCMEENSGKWRFTSPTHTVRAFYQALIELDKEGGISARHKRYLQNQLTLVQGMKKLGFRPLLDESLHSPIITSFYSPDAPEFSFKKFYTKLKEHGFVIYPGKVSHADCFRIGNIGEVYPQDIESLLAAIAKSIYWN